MKKSLSHLPKYKRDEPKRFKETLSHMIGGCDPAFLTVFPRATEQEKECFELLRRAYVKDHLMTIAIVVAMGVSIVLLQGCTPGGGPGTGTPPETGILASPVPSSAASTKEAGPRLLEVKRFAQTKENLRLDYCVTNVFPYDIWVCENINQYVDQDSESSVETQINDRVLQIRRRGNLKQEAHVTAADILAVYRRLQPGASRSDTLLLPLPVRSHSPVRFPGVPIHPVLLDRVVLEVGYFGEELRKWLPVRDFFPPYNRYGYFYGTETAFVSYIIPRRWDKLGLERCAEATVSDVNVPGKMP